MLAKPIRETVFGIGEELWFVLSFPCLLTDGEALAYEKRFKRRRVVGSLFFVRCIKMDFPQGKTIIAIAIR